MCGSGSDACKVAKEVPMRRIKDNFLPVVTALASGIMFAALAMM
jgi:hypothetical protein